MPRKKKEVAPPLPEIRIQLATPMYGGQCTGVFVQSLLELTGALSAAGIRLTCAFMFNESLITRARNNLADQFLQTDNTHLLFIDADMKFRAQDIYHMIMADKDIIVGICPKKEINWHTVKQAALQGQENLGKFTGSFVVNLLEGCRDISVPQNKPFEIAAGGTGIMLIKRKVFTKMKKHVPFFRNDMSHLPGGKPIHQFFTESIDEKTQRLLSEDYHFCHKWRELGGKVWGAPWGKIGHFGTYLFEGQLIEDVPPPGASNGSNNGTTKRRGKVQPRGAKRRAVGA